MDYSYSLEIKPFMQPTYYFWRPTKRRDFGEREGCITRKDGAACAYPVCTDVCCGGFTTGKWPSSRPVLSVCWERCEDDG